MPGQRAIAHDLAPGATLYVLPAPRFRTIHLLLAYRQTLAADTVTPGALLPRVLRRGTRRWPDMPALASHLEDLYGASLGTASSKLGDQQILEVTFSAPGPADLEAIGGTTAGGGPGKAGHSLIGQGAVLAAEVFADPAPPESSGPGTDRRHDPSSPGLNWEYVREEKEALGRDQAAISDDRMSYAHYRCLAEMCKGEPFALHSLGTPGGLETISAEGLDRFRRAVLKEMPLVAYLAGPVDEAMVREVAEVFGALARQTAPAGTGGNGGAGRTSGNGQAAGAGGRRSVPPSEPHPRPENEREIFEPAPVEQGRLVIGLWTGTVLGDGQAPAQVLYNGLLGGFVSSRLFRSIREEAGLAYYAWSRVLPTKGLILISCGIQEKNYARAVELVRKELASLARGDFSDGEFEATRNSVLALAKAQLDSPSSLVYGHLERLTGGLAVEEIAPWRSLAAVTAAEVREFARRPVVDTIYLLGREGEADGQPVH